jgi:hypothetical protein
MAVVAVVLCLAVFGGLVLAQHDRVGTSRAAPAPSASPGFAAYEYMVALSDGIGSRVAGSPQEVAAAGYVKDTLTDLGYAPSVQSFSAKVDGKTIHSQNVIALKDTPSEDVVVIGAHYDSVKAGRGAFDNGSGIGLMLELAQEFTSIDTPYDLEFVAFGSEEVGKGADYFVSHLTADQKSHLRLMVNFDSVAAGDQLCAYSPGGAKKWPRMEFQQIARRLGLDVQTNPGLNKTYPYGTTGDWSDHVPFRKAGIPYLYIEATNWLIGDKDGYTNNAKYGEIWHSPKDTVAWIETVFPGRMMLQLSAADATFREFLTLALPTP